MGAVGVILQDVRRLLFVVLIITLKLVAVNTNFKDFIKIFLGLIFSDYSYIMKPTETNKKEVKKYVEIQNRYIKRIIE